MYPNQIAAAKELIAAFANEPTKQCMLVAEMQSGKSDTFMLTGCELVRTGIYDRFIVFSGNAEITLRDQAKNQRAFFRDYFRYLIDTIGLGDDEAAEISDSIEDNFTVLWSSDLKKHRTKGNTLYIWDESHYAQSDGQRPDAFLSAQGLQVNGEPSKNGNGLLSVSATPFSEQIDNESYSQNKTIVNLVPGEKYIGVLTMENAGNFRPFAGKWIHVVKERLSELCHNESDGSLRCVGLVRIPTGKEDVAALRSLCAEHSPPIKFVLYDKEHTAAGKPDINELLDTDRATVIALKHMVRMGKQIKKEHISWCLETAKQSATDTLLQGLIGRCCGYPDPSGASVAIQFYMARKLCDELTHYVKTGRPTRAMNVKPARKRNFYPTIPEKVEIPLDWHGKDDKKSRIRDFITGGELDRVTRNSPQNLAHLKKMAVHAADNIAGGGTFKFSDLNENGYSGHATRLENAYTNGNILENQGSSCGVRADGTEIRIWYEKSAQASQGTWTVYIQFLTENQTIQNTTTKREVFCRETEDGTVVTDNGSCGHYLLPETAYDMTVMKSALHGAYQLSLLPLEGLGHSRSITSNGNQGTTSLVWKGIQVTKEIERALKKGGSIYKHMKNLGVELKLKKQRGRPPAGFDNTKYTRLSSISW